MTLSRRTFVAGLFVAPAIIKYSNLMPVKVQIVPPGPFRFREVGMGYTITRVDYGIDTIPEALEWEWVEINEGPQFSMRKLAKAEDMGPIS